jgi:hypothetical protein
MAKVKTVLVTLVHPDGGTVQVDPDRVGLYESAGWAQTSK